MKDSPIYKAAAYLLFVILFFIALYYTRGILIPLVFAALLAMVLLPLCRKLEKLGVPRIPSIIICLLLVVILFSIIVYILSSQVVSFANDLALIKEKLLEKLDTIQDYIEGKTNLSAKEQMVWIKEKYAAFLEANTSLIKNIVMSFTGSVIAIGLIMVYVFFFLLYRDRFKIFILKLFPMDHHIRVENVINETKNLILHYLTGLLIALTILSIMNSIGLLALGIRQAIFLGFLAGFLNIIPYIGTIMGSLFPIIMAILFKDSIWYAVGVAAIFLFNQFIDNNITTPKIVGSHVQVNPLATIIAIITGGAVWGVAGMILFIPLLGIFKIICDHTDKLKPIGYLLGDEETVKKEGSLFKKIRGVFGKKK